MSDYKLVLKINYFWVEVKVNIINNIKIVLRKYNIGFSIKSVVIFIFFNIWFYGYIKEISKNWCLVFNEYIEFFIKE